MARNIRGKLILLNIFIQRQIETTLFLGTKKFIEIEIDMLIFDLLAKIT